MLNNTIFLMLTVFPTNLQSLYSISLSGNEMVTTVEEAIMFSKICSGEWVTCSWSQKCEAVVNFPGVMMTHHCTRLCWPGSLSLSNSLSVISIQRSDSVSSPSAKSLLRRELLLTSKSLAASGTPRGIV